MLVRGATKADVDTIAELNAAVQSLHHEQRPDWFLTPDLVAIRSWISTTIDRENVFIFVAEEDGPPVGYALATLHRRPANPFTRELSVLELDQISVNGDARRAGVGSLLIRRVADLADELTIDHLMLTVWNFNEVARATFRARGFVDAMHRMERARA